MIHCYPRGDLEEDGGQYVSMYLELTSNYMVEIKVIFQVFFQGRGGAPSFSHEQKLVEVFSEDSVIYGWNRFLKRSDLESNYLSNGWVTFLCSIIVLGDDTIAVPPSNIGRDLSLLHDCKVGTDVSVTVKGETIQAHRAILAARSQVFQAELYGSLADSASSSITLQDIEPTTFKAMLGFMYTDELPEDNEFGHDFIEMMQHLLAAADRYAMDRLKLVCARKLWDNISNDTFAHILVCAETHNCPELKRKCFDYFAIADNMKKIIFTDGFLLLLQKFEPLAAELKARIGMYYS
jgi:speckle-type POZ protein